MAELLIKATSASHADPEKDESGCYKKGDIVGLQSDGHEWGAKEGLPNFIRVKVPGLSVDTILDRAEPWQRSIDYEIVSTSLNQDGARFRLFVAVPGAANRFGITRQMVEDWVTSWGGVVFSEATNEVRFDITIQAAYKSEAFWGVAPSSVGIVITETAYNKTNGNHTATIDISASSVDQKRVKEAVESHGGVITAYANNVATVRFNRDVIRAAFMDDLRAKLNKTVVRRRYAVSETDVDAVIGMGGEITITAAQLASKVLDKSL